jgi:hypothetical protein
MPWVLTLTRLNICMTSNMEVAKGTRLRLQDVRLVKHGY